MTRESVKTFDYEYGLMIMVPDSMKVEYSRSMDDLMNILISTISCNINPCSLAISKIKIDKEKKLGCTGKGKLIEVATKNHCPLTTRNLVLAIACVLNSYDRFECVQMTLFGQKINIKRIHNDLSRVQQRYAKCSSSINLQGI